MRKSFRSWKTKCPKILLGVNGAIKCHKPQERYRIPAGFGISLESSKLESKNKNLQWSKSSLILSEMEGLGYDFLYFLCLICLIVKINLDSYNPKDILIWCPKSNRWWFRESSVFLSVSLGKVLPWALAVELLSKMMTLSPVLRSEKPGEEG